MELDRIFIARVQAVEVNTILRQLPKAPFSYKGLTFGSFFCGNVTMEKTSRHPLMIILPCSGARARGQTRRERSEGKEVGDELC